MADQKIHLYVHLDFGAGAPSTVTTGNAQLDRIEGMLTHMNSEMDALTAEVGKVLVDFDATLALAQAADSEKNKKLDAAIADKEAALAAAATATAQDLQDKADLQKALDELTSMKVSAVAATTALAGLDQKFADTAKALTPTVVLPPVEPAPAPLA